MIKVLVVQIPLRPGPLLCPWGKTLNLQRLLRVLGTPCAAAATHWGLSVCEWRNVRPLCSQDVMKLRWWPAREADSRVMSCHCHFSGGCEIDDKTSFLLINTACLTIFFVVLCCHVPVQVISLVCFASSFSSPLTILTCDPS